SRRQQRQPRRSAAPAEAVSSASRGGQQRQPRRSAAPAEAVSGRNHLVQTLALGRCRSGAGQHEADTQALGMSTVSRKRGYVSTLAVVERLSAADKYDAIAF